MKKRKEYELIEEGGCPLLPLSSEEEAEDQRNRYRGPKGKLVKMKPGRVRVSPEVAKQLDSLSTTPFTVAEDEELGPE